MKKLIIFFLLGIPFLLQSQTGNQYSGLMSQGTMPDALKQAMTIDEKDKDNSFLRLVAQSGKVVYGTPLNQYLETILDNLLKNDPQLRKEISVMVLKSTTINAYATNKGIIFVNTGLLAQVTNEAELAFVLAHEIIHIVEKHTNKAEKGKDIQSYLNYHGRSREQENEADKLALRRYYASSNYSYEAMLGFFDVLQYSYLPFDNIPFDRSMIETDFYTFDEKYYLKNVKEIRSRDDYVDTLSTHPNLLKRRTMAEDFVAEKNDEGRLAFVQSKELFDQMQKIARFECLHQYLTNHDYGNAYYNAYVMSRSFPEDNYLQEVMAIAVYGMSKHKAEGSLREILTKSSTIEGEKQQVYHIFEKLSKQELNVLAIRLLWQTYKKNTKNQLIFSMWKDAIKDMTKGNKLDLNNFSDYPMNAEIVDDSLETVTVDTTAKNKYERIKSSSSVKVKPSDKFKTFNYMLVDLKQDDEFVSMVSRTRNQIEDEEVLDLVNTFNAGLKQNENVLLFSPLYQFQKKRTIVAKKSLSGEKSTFKSLKKSAKRLNVPFYSLEKKQLATFNTEQYNRYCSILDWLQDVYRLSGNMVFYQSDNIQKVAEEMNCKYTILSTVAVSPDKFFSYARTSELVLSVLCPVSIPIYAIQFAIPTREVQATFNVISLETGRVVLSKKTSFSRTSSPNALINGFFYDCLYLTKKGGKDGKKN